MQQFEVLVAEREQGDSGGERDGAGEGDGDEGVKSEKFHERSPVLPKQAVPDFFHDFRPTIKAF